MGTGPDLVLVHGWGLHGGVWNGLVDRLATHYRLIIPDLPGYGRSRTPPPRYELDVLAEQLLEVTPAATAWLGWSLGAMVALTVALRWPERVRKLILVAATPRFVRGTGWLCAMDETVMFGFCEELKRDYRRTLQRFMSLQAGSKEQARHLVKSLRKELFRFGQPDSGALLSGLEILRDTDLRNRLTQVQAPVQLIHGDRDMLTPIEAAQLMAASLPNARLECIAGAGHAPFLSHPEPFVETVKTFLG